MAKSKAPKNERTTENVVRDALRELEYYAPTNSIQIEEQKSNIESIKRLLKASSKSGRGGAGAPEFIITNPENSDFVVIVECKADTADHGSSQATDYLAGNEIHETADQYAKRCQRYAVDGVRACPEFCVNGLMAGNCRLVRRHDEHQETRRT